MRDNPLHDKRLHAAMDPAQVIPQFADANHVPAHLVAAGATALDGETCSSSEQVARIVLSGALTGYGIVPLPAPIEVDSENVAYWGDWRGGSFVTARPPSAVPNASGDGVDLSGLVRFVRLEPTQAVELCGWVLAGAIHAQPDPLESAPPPPGQTPSTPDVGALMTVVVRDRSAERPWGSGGTSPRVRSVQISANCPVCNEPRGQRRNLNSYDDGEHYSVDVWDNPCGHVDTYEAVVVEARGLATTTTESREPAR